MVFGCKTFGMYFHMFSGQRLVKCILVISRVLQGFDIERAGATHASFGVHTTMPCLRSYMCSNTSIHLCQTFSKSAILMNANVCDVYANGLTALSTQHSQSFRASLLGPERLGIVVLQEARAERGRPGPRHGRATRD